MSSLPPGAFITTLDGHRCTAVPKSTSTTTTSSSNNNNNGGNNNNGNSGNRAQNSKETTTTTSTTTTTQVTSSSTTTTSTTTTQATTTTTTSSTTTSPPPLAAAVTVPTSSSTTSSILPTEILPPSSSTEASVEPTSASSSTTPLAAAVPAAISSPISSPSPLPDTSSGGSGGGGGSANGDSNTTLLTASGSASVVPIGFGADGAAPTTSSVATLQSTNGAGGNSTPNSQSVITVAGSVIGGVAFISLAAVFLWFFRRRMLRKRRSTLLTPLTDNAPSSGGRRRGRGDGYGDREKQTPYEIDRGSIGPTAALNKFRAVVAANMARVKGRMRRDTVSTVNMDRGNSQFGMPQEQNRGTSGGNGAMAPSGYEDEKVTFGEKMSNFWTKVKEQRLPVMGAAALPFSIGLPNRLKKWRRMPDEDDSRDMAQRQRSSSQPDFLTLLSMDDRELDREAQRARVSRNTGSLSSSDRFMGGLNLNFGAERDSLNPFHDANALPNQGASAPASQQKEPSAFNEQRQRRMSSVPRPPADYVADIRRSRGQSVGGTTTRAPSTVYGGGRESLASVQTFNTRRNKFRSDPFDLEPALLGTSPPGPVPSLPAGGISLSGANVAAAAAAGDAGGNGRGRMQSRTSSTGGTYGSGTNSMASAPGVRKPQNAHTRELSVGGMSSKYSSGISLVSAMSRESMGDWSDPGPDVGAGGGGGDAVGARAGWGPNSRESPTQGWRDRAEKDAAAQGKGKRQSGGSQKSAGSAATTGVGKAY